MLDVKYLIASPGRSGSNIVAYSLMNSLCMTMVNDQTPHKEIISAPLIYHTHNTQLQLPTPDSVTVIFPIRINFMDTLISHIITEKTGEWTSYSNKLDSFVVDLELVKRKYIYIKKWRQAFDINCCYKNQIELVFEDFVADPSVIGKKLNLPVATQLYGNKSPYSKDKIQNLQQVIDYVEVLNKDQYLNQQSAADFAWAWVPDPKWK